MQALWPDVVVDENSLAKVISDVRRALGEGPRDPGCIVTIPRRGYRFNADVEVLRAADRGTRRTSGRPTAHEIRSLAVLPFAFLNPIAGDERLGIGLADALITRLGQLRRTLVRPTSSIARFAGASMAPAAAGRELAVDAVITGSIRRAGTTVRVSVQLVSVASDAVIWAEKFDAESRARSSSRIRLRSAWPPRSRWRWRARSGRPPRGARRAIADAYEHYIRGRYLIGQAHARLDAARRCAASSAPSPSIRASRSRTPGLSEAWMQLGLRAAVSQSLRPREVMPKARVAAEKALALDDSLVRSARARSARCCSPTSGNATRASRELQARDRAQSQQPERAALVRHGARRARALRRSAGADPARARDRSARRDRQRQCRIPAVSRRAHRRSGRQAAAHRRDGARRSS